MSVPPEARANTRAGAEAFVRFYIAQLNKGAMIPSSAPLAGLAAPTCVGCQNTISMLTRFERQGKRALNGIAVIENLTYNYTEGGVVAFLLSIHQPAQALVGAGGKELDRMTESRFHLAVDVSHRPQGGWAIVKMGTVS